MKQYKIIFFLLSSLFFIISCKTPLQGYKRDKNIQQRFVNKSVIDSNVKTAVYKAKINVFDNYFSGLFLVKYFAKDTAYHVVLLSEVGLNLLDIEYKNEKARIVSCQDFLNKKMVLNTLKADFLLLFIKPNGINKKYKSKSDENLNQVIKFRKKWHNFYYFCNNENEILKIN